jgi:hypothetical protein
LGTETPYAGIKQLIGRVRARIKESLLVRVGFLTLIVAVAAILLMPAESRASLGLKAAWLLGVYTPALILGTAIGGLTYSRRIWSSWTLSFVLVTLGVQTFSFWGSYEGSASHNADCLSTTYFAVPRYQQQIVAYFLDEGSAARIAEEAKCHEPPLWGDYWKAFEAGVPQLGVWTSFHCELLASRVQAPKRGPLPEWAKTWWICFVTGSTKTSKA